MPNIINELTNKRGLIVYGGGSSSDYGIVVSEAPSFDKPTKRSNVFNVQGRNGSIIFQDGSFDDVTRSYKVWVAKDNNDLADKVNAVSAWLYSKSGYQRLEDSFEPDVFRLAYFNGSGNFSNELMSYGETTLSFTCRPERFLKSGEQEIEVQNGDSIFNPTMFDAKPLIHIEGSEVVAFNISGTAIVANISDFINIDCDRLDAYRLPSENRNAYISETFPKIQSGANTIGITGTVSKVTITPRFYTI
jgi:phage-related protein